jgi:multidrug efflux pump subunit AcrA (membrane-fusion protein)
LAALPLMPAVPVLAWALLPHLRAPVLDEKPLTCVAQRGLFLHEVTVKGTVESSANVEVACEVAARDFWQTKILELVPEGTHVEKGDLLARFDSSPLENICTQQQIRCNTSEAEVVEALAGYETARIALEQYREATYLEKRQTIESSVFVAEEKLRQARQKLGYNERLLARGYITELQMQAERFGLEKAQKGLESAQTELDVLDDYSREKMVKYLESRIKIAEARLKSERHSYQKHLEELKNLEEQIAKCEVRSPGVGSVVYVHLYHGDHNHIIEEGAEIREHQVFIRLPDPSQMHVKSKIPEEKVALVTAGLPAILRFDAFTDLEVAGEVRRVSEYPEVDYWVTTKNYETIIGLDATSVKAQRAELKTGLTADVSICVQRLEDQLQVPLQALLKHGAKQYCVTFDREGWKAHEVEVGPDNGKYAVINGGLEEGQEVVLGAAAYRDKVGLPALPSASERPSDD